MGKMLAEVFEKLKWILIQFYGSSDYILDIGIWSLQIEALNVFFFSNQARAPCFSKTNFIKVLRFI